uniref:U81-Liphistoxin-Lsp1b_1 n=1 Tax=Liphistius sp. SGP-2016 TaxID=1905180 RepID=A0A4V2H8W9_9ARAC
MRTLFAICIAVAFVIGSEAMRCPECEPKKCPDIDLSSCERGTIADACFCCTVCKRTLGEECGGPWSVHGECEIPYFCAKPYPPIIADININDYEFLVKGVCKPLV